MTLDNEQSAKTLDELIVALSAQGEQAQVAAAEALRKLGDQRGVEPLIGALDAQSWHVRRNAAQALGKLGDQRAVEPLIALVQKPDTPTVMLAAIEALGKLGDQRAIAPLLSAQKSATVTMQHAIDSALLHLDEPGHVARVKAQQQRKRVRMLVMAFAGLVLCLSFLFPWFQVSLDCGSQGCAVPFGSSSFTYSSSLGPGAQTASGFAIASTGVSVYGFRRDPADDSATFGKAFIIGDESFVFWPLLLAFLVGLTLLFLPLGRRWNRGERWNRLIAERGPSLLIWGLALALLAEVSYIPFALNAFANMQSGIQELEPSISLSVGLGFGFWIGLLATIVAAAVGWYAVRKEDF